MIVCDFCNDTRVAWLYPTDSFHHVVPGIDFTSTGDWMACDACADLVEVSDTEGLTARCARRYVEYNELGSTNAVELVADGMRSVHEMFVAHRAGPRRPI